MIHKNYLIRRLQKIKAEIKGFEDLFELHKDVYAPEYAEEFISRIQYLINTIAEANKTEITNKQRVKDEYIHGTKALVIQNRATGAVENIRSNHNYWLS